MDQTVSRYEALVASHSAAPCSIMYKKYKSATQPKLN